MHGSEIAAVSSEHRAIAESLMVDVVRIVREGAPVTDNDGVVTRPGVEVFTGPARFQSSGQRDWATSQVAEALTDSGSLVVQLPFDTSAAVRVGDVVEVVESLDAALSGRRLRVVGDFTKTHAVARRFMLEVAGRS